MINYVILGFISIEQKRCPYIEDNSGSINKIDGLLCNGWLQFILSSKLLIILAGAPLYGLAYSTLCWTVFPATFKYVSPLAVIQFEWI